MPEECTKIWSFTLDQLGWAASLGSIASGKANLPHAEYKILHAMSDPLISTLPMHEDAAKPDAYLQIG